jgi:dipeptidyl aminopeptidase/acylaminoacyl peptidase
MAQGFNADSLELNSLLVPAASPCEISLCRQPIHRERRVDPKASRKELRQTRRYLAAARLTIQMSKTRADIWVLPLFGDRQPVRFVQTSFGEREARFSPDGRWVAYTSDETGAREVFVQTFPARGGKWQISRGGAGPPEWRGDGKRVILRERGEAHGSRGEDRRGELRGEHAEAAFRDSRLCVGRLRRRDGFRRECRRSAVPRRRPHPGSNLHANQRRIKLGG